REPPSQSLNGCDLLLANSQPDTERRASAPDAILAGHSPPRFFADRGLGDGTSRRNADFPPALVATPREELSGDRFHAVAISVRWRAMRSLHSAMNRSASAKHSRCVIAPNLPPPLAVLPHTPGSST